MRIVEAVREKAQEIPKFRNEKNGAIRILAYPLCKEADNWLGGLSDFDVPNPDIVDYEHTFSITPGGSRITQVVENGIKKKVDCYAYSALKIAHCSLAQDLKVGLSSGLLLDMPYLTEEYGYAAHLGAICVEIKRPDDVVCSDGLRFSRSANYCGMYVCVSGADPKEDQACAAVALPVIKKYFREQPDGPFNFVYDTFS